MTCSDRPGTSTCLLHQQEHVRVHKTIAGATWRHQDLTSPPGTSMLLKCNRNLIFYSRRFKEFSAVNPDYLVTPWISKRKKLCVYLRSNSKDSRWFVCRSSSAALFRSRHQQFTLFMVIISLLLLKKVKLMAKRTIRITKSCRCRISSTDLSKRQV